MNEKEIMSEEAFKELIDNLEIIEKLTPYERKAIKYWVNKLQKENEELTTALSKQSKDIGNYLVELQQKDKQIDLSAEFIKKNISEKKIINEICIKGKCNNEECHEDDIKDCIKQYFETKAKEKGE